MSARYGDRTRSGEPVGNAGQRQTGGTGTPKQIYQQTFLSPGTWTWPGKVSTVTVTVVGGGGGGGAGTQAPAHPASQAHGGSGGGGGRVRREVVTVSGPVPVTIGAGGTGGLGNNVAPAPAAAVATNGGSSFFGPSTPPLPATTIEAGGGGAGGSCIGPDGSFRGDGKDAPATGGGGGGGASSSLPGYPAGGRGAFGQPGGSGGSNTVGGGCGGGMGGQGSGISANPSIHGITSRGFQGYGGGGAAYYVTAFGSSVDGAGNLTVDFPAWPTNRNALANSGAGGYGATASPNIIPVVPSPTAYNGGNGGSGIVIVEWWE